MDTLFRTEKKVDFKPSAIFRKAQLDSASKSPPSLVSRAAFTREGVGERRATCMHSKLKQQTSDNGQLTQVKMVYERAGDQIGMERIS